MKLTAMTLIASVALATSAFAMNDGVAPFDDARYRAELGDLITPQPADNETRTSYTSRRNLSVFDQSKGLAAEKAEERYKLRSLYR